MTDTIYTAYAKAFAEIGAAAKQANNPHFKSKYADLPSVIDAIKGPLANHGLAFIQKPFDCERGVSIETILLHSAGEQMSLGVVSVPVDKNNAHGTGSAMTYARRYGLMAGFGVPAEDDDGNAAVAAPPKRQEQSSAPTGKLEGPYPSKSALDKAFKAFYRELQGCGDSGEFEGCLSVPEHKALIKQLMRDWPSLVTGGDDMPEEYIPLQAFVKARRSDFEMLEQQ